MRPQKIEEQYLLNSLSSVFKTKGYEGATLSELSAACGLKKASLYHRFPNGKVEIAQAVLVHIDNWIDKNINAILMDTTLLPSQRIDKAIESINELYDEGKETCILRALLTDGTSAFLGSTIKQIMRKWEKAFASFGRDYGLNKKIAEERAIQVLIYVQGSLIVSKGLSKQAVFKSTIESIRSLYPFKENIE
jgi:AcrR family transcriptional regulator